MDLSDLNGDGRLDAALATHDSQFVVLLNTGKGFDGPLRWHGAGGQRTTLLAFDWSGDGKPDIAINSVDGLVTIRNTSR